jgi:hypothetical protein
LELGSYKMMRNTTCRQFWPLSAAKQLGKASCDTSLPVVPASLAVR